MAESAEETLFQDVYSVQARLESLFVTNYDANRIYDRLETYLNETDRVDRVVKEIVDAIGAPLDVLPDPNDSDDNLSQDIVVIQDHFTANSDSDDDYIRPRPKENSEAEQAINLQNHSEQTDSNIMPIPVIDVVELNNNDPNNNTDTEHPVVIPVPTREDVLNMEARQVLDIVPQFSLKKIRSYLDKYENTPDRVATVVNLCINKHFASKPTKDSIVEKLPGESNALQMKSERVVCSSTVNDRAINQKVNPSSTATRAKVEQQLFPASNKPEGDNDADRNYLSAALPLGVLLKPTSKDTGLLLPSTLSLSNRPVNYNQAAAEGEVKLPEVKKRTDLPSAQGVAPISEILTEQTEPMKSNLVGTPSVAQHTQILTEPVIIDVVARQSIAIPPGILMGHNEPKNSNLVATQSVAPLEPTGMDQKESVKSNLVATQSIAIPTRMLTGHNEPKNGNLVAMQSVAPLMIDKQKEGVHGSLVPMQDIVPQMLTEQKKPLKHKLVAAQALNPNANPFIAAKELLPYSEPRIEPRVDLLPGTSKGTVLLGHENSAGSALLMESQPSASKRKILEDPGGKVAVEEKKAKMPESVPKQPHKYLHTVRDMFPTVDAAYLQQCCDQFGEADIGVLISHLLETPDKPQRAPQVHVEEQLDPSQLMASYQALQDILPDADPDYLRETWERVGSNQEELKQFVADAFENRNYPKLVDYQKRLKMAALQKKFTEEFSIEGFLEMFPDPFKHFENLQTNGKPTHSTTEGRSFLMARYPKIRCNEIDRCHRKFNFRLLETCKELDKFPKTSMMKSTRKNFEIPVYKTNKNLAFLQEIAFIENEAKIRQHIKDIEDRRMKMFEEAKAKGELLACGCCFDDEFLPEDMAACDDGHLFCKECIKKGAEVEIGKGKTELPCLMDCGQMISLQTLKGILLPSVFIRLDQRIQIEEVKAAGIEDLETCPFCDFGTIPSHDDKVFKCLNPDCMKESCRLCKDISHIPFRCDEVEKSEEVKLRTYIEDRMTEALVRTCWKCKKKFIKEDGCNKMTCTCGALMCYLCRQPVKDYSHFNGQGGDAIDKCPLYSNNDQLHVDAVREEAKKAKEEVESKNPQLALKHDPTKILPTAKATKNGNPGHRNILNPMRY